MSKATKFTAVVLAGVMTLSMAACGGSSEPAPAASASAAASTAAESTVEESTAAAESTEAVSEEAGPFADYSEEDLASKAADYYAANFDSEGWWDESGAEYESILGGFHEYYEKAMAAGSTSEKYALEAIAEAKMLESGIFIPLSTRGGNYSISRVVPYSINTTLWGSDSDRFYSAIVATDFIQPADRDELKAKWAEIKGTGEYSQWARDFLTEKGYTLKDEYRYPYNADPVTWDVLASSRETEAEKIVNTYDGLLVYNNENEQVPALATEYSVSEDGLTYTFKLREGVTWVDSQGRKVADLKADDFVAGMQHMCDAAGGLEYLVGAEGANIVNADEYCSGDVTDFAQVGVKAVDDYTVEYTLNEPNDFFLTMLAYQIFAPMSRSYYESQGGKFGLDNYDEEDPGYQYGKDPDHIAYCGPYLVTNATEKNTIVFKANDSYWNKDAVSVKTLTWVYEDGTDELKVYNDALAGTVDGCVLTDSRLETAKKDGNFDKYAFVAATDATSFCGFFNVNRKAYANFNDASVAVSEKTLEDALRTHAAMNNQHFRLGLMASLDRGSYNAQDVGEELKYTSLRNTYTPGTFVMLAEDTTVDINGTATTFPAGTFYGAIMQAQLDADGAPFKAWDPAADGGIGSSDGFDGWYNPEVAASEIEQAVAELAEAGIEVTPENPIQIDVPYFSGSERYQNKENVLKQSIEGATKGYVKVNLVPCESQDDWLNAGYFPENGYEFNGDMFDVSGWGPDYGDPKTYLATMLPEGAGYMVKSIGMY